MSVTTETNRVVFVGDGTDNSPYAISFPLRDTGSVEVIYVTVATGAEVVKVIATDYTIALADDFVTANLTLVTAAPATGVNLLIRSNEPITRLSEYANFDGQPSATTNSDFDKGTMKDRTLGELLDRTIQVSKGHPNASLPLTPLILKGAAGKTIVVKSDETDFELLTDSIADGTITPAKLLDGTVDNQLIQYDSGAAEWKYETNITIPGTLTVTGAATLSSTLASGALTVTGAVTVTTTITATGIVTGATGSVFGNLTLADGSITDSSGAISFGNENLTTTGLLTAASDADTVHILGRAKVGGAANQAVFCHFDRDSNNNRAITQLESGETQILSSSGQITGFFIGSTEHMTLSATILALTNGTDFKTPGGTQAFINNASSSVASALAVIGSMSLKEQAAADANLADYGQFWVKTAVPNEPWFDGDTGVERQLMQGDGTTVVDESVFTADGTTGGLLKETAMILTAAGAVSGLTTLATSGLATLNSLSVTTTTLMTGDVRIGGAGAGHHLAIKADGNSNVMFACENSSGNDALTLFVDGSGDGILAVRDGAGTAFTQLHSNAGSFFRGTGVEFGEAGVQRGVLEAHEGAGGNTAGYIILNSRDGTRRFMFVEDDGTLKLHTAAPVDNADGVVVGAQT